MIMTVPAHETLREIIEVVPEKSDSKFNSELKLGCGHIIKSNILPKSASNLLKTHCHFCLHNIRVEKNYPNRIKNLL